MSQLLTFKKYFLVEDETLQARGLILFKTFHQHRFSDYRERLIGYGQQVSSLTHSERDAALKECVQRYTFKYVNITKARWCRQDYYNIHMTWLYDVIL